MLKSIFVILVCYALSSCFERSSHSGHLDIFRSETLNVVADKADLTYNTKRNNLEGTHTASSNPMVVSEAFVCPLDTKAAGFSPMTSVVFVAGVMLQPKGSRTGTPVNLIKSTVRHQSFCPTDMKEFCLPARAQRLLHSIEHQMLAHP